MFLRIQALNGQLKDTLEADHATRENEGCLTNRSPSTSITYPVPWKPRFQSKPMD